MAISFQRSIGNFFSRFVPASDFGKLVLVFFISHFFILVNRSIGWDGYSVLNGSYQDLLNGFRAEGHTDLHPRMFYFLKTLTPYPIRFINR